MDTKASNGDAVERLVVFSILMENNDGIVGKAPSYIWEKFQLAMGLPLPQRLLDWENIEKFGQWRKAWGR